MRWVSDTDRKPECMLSATAQSTEWTITNTSEGRPSPNHSRASGSRAMAGRGLNMAVKVESRSVPTRLVTATVVSSAAMMRPRK